MRISQINYSEALKGITRVAMRHPMESWFAAQGAKYLGSNEFIDPTLKLSEDHFENVLKIIKSARLQGHDGVEIRLTDDSYSAIHERISEISSIEDVEIDSHFHGKYRGKEQIVAVFRKASRAPEVVERPPLSNEDLERLFDDAAREVEEEKRSGSAGSYDDSTNAELKGALEGLKQIFGKNE